MGSHGMDSRSGFNDAEHPRGGDEPCLIEAGRRLIILADHTKWGIIGISSVARLGRMPTRSSPIPASIRWLGAKLTSSVRRLMLVDVATGEAAGRLRAGRAEAAHDGRPGLVGRA